MTTTNVPEGTTTTTGVRGSFTDHAKAMWPEFVQEQCGSAKNNPRKMPYPHERQASSTVTVLPIKHCIFSQILDKNRSTPNDQLQCFIHPSLHGDDGGKAVDRRSDRGRRQSSMIVFCLRFRPLVLPTVHMCLFCNACMHYIQYLQVL